MKKILALILLVSCIFTLCSCGLFKKDDNNDSSTGGSNNQNSGDKAPTNTEAVADIQAKIDASKPSAADITVTLESALDDLNSEYNVTYNQDGSATVEYTYEKFNDFDDATDEYKSTYTGTVTVLADGTLNGDVDGIASVEALTFDIKLDSSKLESAEIVAGVFTATVKAANTASILGINLGVDASIVVSTNASGVVFIAISYTSAAGPIEIIATYTYSVE